VDGYLSEDQLRAMRLCKVFIGKNPLAWQILQLISKYAQIDSKFGFNPKDDKLKIITELTRIKDRINYNAAAAEVPISKKPSVMEALDPK
jgi:hypothetical protein